ncbi:MAG: 3-oxoacyl-[acyl-carrier protein] reductase [Thermoleophilaceae bacterium]|nr:3-oxoacyl-[acyl-carrier protein] reductase [Thermoleophilaceae bacterium]
MASDALAGRVALVTGASGGIGAAIARELAHAGASVALAYARDATRADELARELAAGGARVLTAGADLADRDAADQLVDDVERELGAIDVLVPNAGVGRIRQRIEDVTDADWDDHIAVNLTAPFLLARRVAPGMASRGFGRILFVSSVAAFTGGVVGPHYAASKAGLHGLTHWLASRLAGDGVTVNAIAPALIEGTGMLPGASDELRARIPVGRLGTPDEVADLALAVLRNGYLTNQVLTVDGGIYSR